MEALAEGSILIGNVGSVPTPLDAKTNAQILIGNGTTADMKAMSGDIAIDNAGATTIQPNSIEQSMLNFGIGGELRAVSRLITWAELTAINTTPLELLANGSVLGTPDVSKISLEYVYDTSGLVLGGDFQIQTNDSVAVLNIPQADLIGSANKFWSIPNVAIDNGPGYGFQIKGLVSDPTGGAAGTSLKVTLYYTDSL